MNNLKLIVLSLFFTPLALADLVALNDVELQSTSGAGLGFALEDFALVSRGDEGSVLKVTGIDDSNGGEIDINWTEFYILGEGSDKGQNVDNKAQIGSYLHPWTIRTARGSRGLVDGDVDFNEAYSGVGNDVALLEFATDSYSSNIQNSASYAEFSNYQGCIYGQAGCTDLGYDASGNSLAERRVLVELDSLRADKAAIDSRYASNITLSALESAQETAFGDEADIDSIAHQITVVDEQFDVAAGVKAQTAAAYSVMTQEERGETGYLFRPGCATDLWDGCSDAEDAYDELVIAYFEEVVILEEERDELDARENDPTRTGVGQSYIVVTKDIDRHKALCGFDDDLASCEDGAVASKQATADNVESVTFNLNNGVQQRDGLDVGLSFEFQVNRADGSTRDDFLDVDIRGLFIDGSSFKLWSRPDKNDPTVSELNAELRLNIFAKEIDVRVCNDNECVNEAEREEATLHLDNFFVNLNLGYGDVQPLKLSATSDGNFQFLLEELDPSDPVANSLGLSAEDFYQDYYANSPKSNVRIGDVRLGATNSIGGVTISGLRAQYLKVTSQDLN